MEKKSETFQIASDIQWEYAGDGIVRQIMGYDEHLMMVKVKFNQGAVGTLHQHPHTQSTYVASGCFEVTIGKEKKVLRAGDGYYVAPLANRYIFHKSTIWRKCCIKLNGILHDVSMIKSKFGQCRKRKPLRF